MLIRVKIMFSVAVKANICDTSGVNQQSVQSCNRQATVASTKPRLVPSTLSGQYFPCADPCTDISLSRPATKVTLSFIKTSGSSLNLQKRGLGAESDSDSDRGKMLTDSSLCSDQVAHVILVIIVMRSFLRSGMLSGQTAASL